MSTESEVPLALTLLATMTPHNPSADRSGSELQCRYLYDPGIRSGTDGPPRQTGTEQSIARIRQTRRVQTQHSAINARTPADI